MSKIDSNHMNGDRNYAYSIPLEKLDPADPEAFQKNEMWWKFERLRKEDPVHFTPESRYGPYWSITKYHDIVAIETDHKTFSSEGGICILTPEERPATAMGTEAQPPTPFIMMDPPKHDIHRKAVSPAVSPMNLSNLEPLIRERAELILDDLPIGTEFDWVDKVSMELTAMTLATLFGMPQKDRRKLNLWSDLLLAAPGPDSIVKTLEEKSAHLMEFQNYFNSLWNERVNSEPQSDLISMLAHSPGTRNMRPAEFIGNIILLTIGGNDTTRNTISGSVYALHKFPDQRAALYANPKLLPSMVSETIRWQTPLAHMMRTATRDVEFKGKTIRKDDKVLMWYVSGNRDEDVIKNPNDYHISREKVRQHLSFGFGIHRCVGNRLAELQLRVVWEEIMKRYPEIHVVAEPKRVRSNFPKGYTEMKVLIPRRF